MKQIQQRYEDAVPVDKLRPHPLNANLGASAVIAESIGENGWYGAVVAHEGTGYILAGNHRWEEAQKAGADTVPVIWLEVDEKRASKILAVDNESSRKGRNDDSRLAALLESFDGDFTGTGYGQDDLDALLASLAPAGAARTDPDAVPEPPAEPVTQPGDLWQLGPHRVLCGDATDRAAYERVLNGERAALGLTDPPYGIGMDYGSGVTDDEASISALIDAFVPLILTHAERSLVTSGQGLAWLYPRPTWVLGWVEPSGVGSGPWGFCCWQPVLAYGKDPFLAAGLGRRPDTYVGKSEGPSDDRHPVAKPITVWSWLMERGSVKVDDLILDPFGGSGTTVIAAHALNRRAAVIELSPAYVDVIAKRYQEHVGVLPVLGATGEAHDFING